MKNQSAMFQARPTKCKRCGCEDVAWAQNRNGKWYLVEGGYCHPDLRDSGYLLFSKLHYHDCKKYKERMKKIHAEIEWEKSHKKEAGETVR